MSSVPPPAPAASRPFKTPDITPAQIVAIAGAAIGLAVAFGAPISHDKQVALTNFVTIFAPILIAIDAAIRGARAKWLHGPLLAAELAHDAAALAPQVAAAAAALEAANAAQPQAQPQPQPQAQPQPAAPEPAPPAAPGLPAYMS